MPGPYRGSCGAGVAYGGAAEVDPERGDPRAGASVDGGGVAGDADGGNEDWLIPFFSTPLSLLYLQKDEKTNN